MLLKLFQTSEKDEKLLNSLYELYRSVVLYSMFLRPAASGNLLEIQIIWSHPRPTESETQDPQLLNSENHCHRCSWHTLYIQRATKVASSSGMCLLYLPALLSFSQHQSIFQT